jgi:hypothetical protein
MGGSGGDGWASAAATLTQADRCRTSKDTLAMDEGHQEKPQLFLEREPDRVPPVAALLT